MTINDYWPTLGGITRSLRTGTDAKSCWYPIPIRTWEAVFETFSTSGTPLIVDRSVKQNLAYNLQYLQYLQQTLVELRLSEVLERQTIKGYVIVAIGVVECLLYHLNSTSGGTQSKLTKIIERVQSKELLGKAAERYAELHRFRELRNKVHIYELRDQLGTDYQAFGRQEFRDMRRILYELATNPNLGLSTLQAGPFEFLRSKVWVDTA
jgi:hypothetical protein